MRIFPAFIIAILFLQSCLNDECSTTVSYLAFEPVYKTVDEINEGINFVESEELKVPGKIYFYRNYLLISEKNEGVHIYDNLDPAKPKKLGFIRIEGNIDVAMKAQYIYADTKYNIIVIDISDIRNPRVVNVLKDVKNDQIQIEDGKYIVDYRQTDIKEELDCSEYRGGFFYRGDVLFVDKASSLELQAGGIPDFGDNGSGGSLARMALFDGYFYYVNNHLIHIFDASDLSKPRELNQLDLGWGIETLFPYKDKLFIGANNGMHILDNSNPAKPVYLSTFAHARACDPVVVEGTTAYVTLRDGRECESFANQLDVIDITDVLKPYLIASYKMSRPEGLAVRDNILYLCEGKEGLKIFNVENKEEIDKNYLGGIREYYARDVISVTKDLLLMVGEKGFYQFDTKDPGNPGLLSSIELKN